jgi:hypothetical protein
MNIWIETKAKPLFVSYRSLLGWFKPASIYRQHYSVYPITAVCQPSVVLSAATEFVPVLRASCCVTGIPPREIIPSLGV